MITVNLEDIRREIKKYLDSEFDDYTNLPAMLASDDLSAIIMTLEKKFSVFPNRQVYMKASTVNDLFRIFKDERELR